MGKKKNKTGEKKKKIALVFDPKARREFLTGFHKRKLERREKYQAELKQMIKDERKKIQHNAKDSLKKMAASYRSVPEVAHLLNEEHDLGSHSVEIKELSMNELAEENNWIGANQGTYVKEEDSSDAEDDDAESAQSDSELIPGMDLKRKPEKKIKPEKDSSKPKKSESKTKTEFKSVKDIKRVIRKQSTKFVKKSKAFQMKNNLERTQNRKKACQQRRRNVSKLKRSTKGRRILEKIKASHED